MTKLEEENNPPQSRVEPVYGVTGIDGASKAKINLLGEERVFVNEPVDHSHGGSTQLAKNIQCSLQVCKYRRVTLVQEHKKNLPILFLDVWYTNSNSLNHLFRLVFSFEITNASKKDDEFLNQELEGNFLTQVVIDNESQDIDTKFKTFPGRRETVDTLISFLRGEEMIAFMHQMIKQDMEKKQREYEKHMEDYSTIPKPTIKM